MSSGHASLDAAATERKARLAKLASLKRKQPEPDTATENPNGLTLGNALENPPPPPYLSGRNYDVETRGPKLGFESAPSANTTTLEDHAARIALTTAEAAAKEEKEAEKGIDLFKLQPRKPNWDLKRDLDEKLKVLNVRTENAIARLVRERIQNAKTEAQANGKNGVSRSGTEAEGEEVGMDGGTLVEGVHVREREEEEQEKRERAEEQDLETL